MSSVTIDLRIFVFADTRTEVESKAAAFLHELRATAPYGVSIRGHRAYRGIPRRLVDRIHEEVDAILKAAA